MAKKIIPIIVFLLAAYLYLQEGNYQLAPDSQTSPGSISTEHKAQQQQQTPNNSVLLAYQNKRSDVQVKGSGRVIRLLADDLEGSRHQKFILRVADSLTVLMSHNIDLAPRINNLNKGDTVEFNGEYEWTNKGGVIHWTHHDPAGRHEDGWLKHKGRLYQ